MKLVNNLVLGLNRVALAEGLVFAKAIGLDPAKTLDVLKEGNSYSGVMDTKGRKMIDGDFSLQAKLSQHAKDVRIILEEAARGGISLPLSRIAPANCWPRRKLPVSAKSTTARSSAPSKAPARTENKGR